MGSTGSPADDDAEADSVGLRSFESIVDEHCDDWDVSDRHYRRLIDHSPNMTCVHESGRVTYINPIGVKMMGAQSPEQIIGRPITEFVHPDSIQAMVGRIASLRQVGDASHPSEAMLLRLDGTTLDVEAVSVLTEWKGNPAYQVIFRDLTSQRAAEEILRFQATMVNGVSDAIIATTFTGIVTSWNPAAEAIYRRAAAHTLAMPIQEAVGAQLDPRAIIAKGGVVHTIHHASDGTALDVRVSVAAMANGFVLVCCDQTALRRIERRFQTVVASLEDGVVVLGSDGHIDSANPAAMRILGISDENAIDDPIRHLTGLRLYDAESRPIPYGQEPIRELVRTRASQVGHIFGVDRLSDGARIWLSVNTRPLNPDDPEDTAVLISFTDVTAQRHASRQLAHQAAHDTLTGLPNRANIFAHIEEQHRCQDLNRLLTAVLFIDLDNFKPINDSLGHGTGDKVLRIAAQRLRAALRSHDIVGRLGGDEFVILIQGQITRLDLDHLADRLHTMLAQPMQLASDMLTVGASIGIVTIDPNDRRDQAQILHDADTAMYAAKKAGGGITCYFTETLRQQTD